MRSPANPPDYVFLSLVGILVVFGLVVLASASSVFSYEKFGSSFYLTRHQIFFGLIPGLIFFLITLRVPYLAWRSLALPFLIAAFALLILVLIPGVGVKLGGARSWFSVGSLSFQPSEIAKLGLILYVSAWAARRTDTIRDFKTAFLPFTAVVMAVGLPVMLQPDIGTLGILGLIALFLAFAVGIRPRYLAGLLGVGALLLAALVKIAPYRAARLTSFIHPELDPQGIGYHINQALLAIGSGGFFGVGFGQSRQKFRYLPEVTGDSIFAIAAEELGFLFSAGLIILLLALMVRMFRIARNAPDPVGRFITLGIAGWFAIQSFINIGSMVGLLPLTGLPLPFISYGGTALAVELAAVGIVGNISRYAR